MGAMGQLEREVVAYFEDPEARAEPFDFYRRLRETAPIYRSPGVGLWIASSYEAVNQTMQAEVSYIPRSNRPGAVDPNMGRARKILYATQFLFLDPPEHNRLRNFVKKTLSGTNSERWRPAIARWMERLQDEVGNRSQIELVSEVAMPAPFKVICEIIGLPYEDVPLLHHFVKGFLALHAPHVTAEMDAQADEEFAGFCKYLEPLLQKRLSGEVHNGDVFDELVEYLNSGDITFEQLGLMLMLLMVGGHETTGGMLGSAVYRLLQNRDQWEAVVNDPSLAPLAVEETLRYETPARQLQPKTLVKDTEIAGTVVPAGAQVIPLLAAAHRDPDVFPDPERFDIHRNAKLNLAFGFGRHFCIGAAFARVEGEEFLRSFPQRFSNIYQDGPVTWDPSIMLRGLKNFPVRVG